LGPNIFKVADFTPIAEFRQEYRFLSNFWPARVFLPPHFYPTVEAAYQAAKTADPDVQEAIRRADSPAMARRLGRQAPLRPDWEAIKLEVMADLLWQKFILNRALRERLLATGDRELVEGNTWSDVYWGRCGGVGENHLGRLLQEIRTVARHVHPGPRP
jgi:ribA/ribD-fused uncharacterized protein